MDLTPLGIPIPDASPEPGGGLIPQLRAQAREVDALIGAIKSLPDVRFQLRASGMDDSPALNAMVQDLVGDYGGGRIFLPDESYTLTDSLILGSTTGGSDGLGSFTGVGLEGSNGLVGTTLNWAGATNKPMIKITRGRFNHISDLFLNNTVARGTTVGILSSGPTHDMQTTKLHLERLNIRGFNKGYMPGDPTIAGGGSATDGVLLSVVEFDNCDYGFYGSSNFNEIKFHSSRCGFFNCGTGVYSRTSYSLSFEGCYGSGNTVVDFDVSNNGLAIVIVGWDGEVSRKFLMLGNNARALVLGAQLRKYTLPRVDNEALIEAGGPVELKSVFQFSDRPLVFTADASTDVITSPAHLLANGDVVSLLHSGSGGTALPAPLAVSTYYYVRDVTTNTLKLAATAGGAAINLTTNGTGTNTLSPRNGPHVIQALGYPISVTQSSVGDDHPIWVDPGSGVADGTSYAIDDVSLLDSATGAPYAKAQNEKGVIIWPTQVPLVKNGVLS